MKQCEVELSRLEIESAVNASPMAALEKLNRFFTITWEYKQSYIKSARWLAPILMADGDIVIRHKFDERTANMCATLLAQIISQGVEEGVFNTPNPQAVSQLIIRSWDSLKGAGATTLQEQHDVTLLAPRIKQVLDFYIDSVERLLGTEEGAGQVDRDDPVPFLKGRIHYAPLDSNTGAVHDPIERLVVLQRRGIHLVDSL